MDVHPPKNSLLFDMHSDSSQDQDNNCKVSQKQTQISQLNRQLTFITPEVVKVRNATNIISEESERYPDSTQRHLTHQQDNQPKLSTLDPIYQPPKQPYHQTLSNDQPSEEEISTPPIKRNHIKQQIIIEDEFDKVINHALPEGYRIVCLLNIQPRLMGLSSTYTLYLKDGRIPLLSAKKQLIKITSNYIISRNLQPRHINKRDNNYVGTLQANFSGTQFIYRDTQQQDICMIEYQKNIMGWKGLRQMKVIKPSPKIKKSINNKLTNLIQHQNKIQILTTIKPKLIAGKYKIDFDGKAKQPSTKNFILINSKNIQSLLFAKQNQKQYYLRISYPLTILEAFSICLSSLDSKLLCN